MSIVEEMDKMLRSSGSTYIQEGKLKKRCHPAAIRKAWEKGALVKRVLNSKTYYTLPYIAGMEVSIAENIVAHVNEPNTLPDLPEEEIDRMIDAFEVEMTEKMGFEYRLHFEQRNAVKMVVNSHMGIITGGPGTGKTTVINCIRYVENHRAEKEPQILFTAPTGKAARRITESVGVPSKTVQKQIGANDFEDTPYITSAYMMVVDEVSMLDTVTMYQLMRAVDPEMKLILVGDVDQLPSVGIGSVLRDLIDSRVVPVTKLEKTFRQGAETFLAKNIAYLRKGYAGLEQGDDFVIYDDFDDESIVEALLDETLAAFNEYGRDKVILLTPYRRKGSTCANVMNNLLQERMNHSPICVEATIEDEDEDGEIYTLDVKFKVGDPVMQLVNRKDCPIANGDVGFVEEIYENDSVYVDFGHFQKIYQKEELKELNLAYAMSVHKSQGSEYPCVITLALPEHTQLLNRNMVYTAVTRAKKVCKVFCKEDVMKKALQVEGGYIRDTFLCEEIRYQSLKRKLLASTVA